MDEQDVWDCIGVVALGLVVAAVVWLVVSPGSGGGSSHPQAGVSGRQAVVAPRPPRLEVRVETRPVSAHRRLLEQMRSCLDATAARGMSGCVVALEPTAPATTSDRPVQPIRATAVGVAPSTEASTPDTSPATVQPATVQPAAPQSTVRPVRKQQPPPPHGPVPGGNTSAPHPGPRP